MLVGAAIQSSINQVEILSIATTGKVISGESLNNFWNEVVGDVYGKVIRAKGIFHLEDGNIIYADFINGVECIDFIDLNLLSFLHGEPKFFSGLEIVGFSLNQVVLRQIIEQIYVNTYSIVEPSSLQVKSKEEGFL